MSKIHVLYVGDDDWTTKYSIPDNIEFEVYESDESELTANRPARKLMDLVILDRDITLSEEKAFTKFTRGYCLFATENVQMLNSATSRYFKARMGQYLYTGDVQYFLAHEVRNYYPNPYGEKFNPAKLAVSDSFTGRVACDGNYNLVLDGEFGENFSQIAYWRYNIPVFEGQCIDMYLEYEKTGDVEIKLRLFQFYYGSIGDIKQVWEFDEEQLQDVFRIDNESDQGPVFVSILARGTGSLNIISLHDRHSRRGHGFFLPGGERLVSSKGEEVFVYFEKGDMKPPLAVYFSGYRTQEGFEGYYMMRGFGCPFILVTDPRSEGGAFYLGDSEFEQMITDNRDADRRLPPYGGGFCLCLQEMAGQHGGLLGAPRCHQPVYHGFRRQGRHLQDHVFRPSSAAPSAQVFRQRFYGRLQEQGFPADVCQQGDSVSR